jgi:hypothetical protein
MKTIPFLCCLASFIASCMITWKAESTLFASVAYALLVAMVAHIAKSLVSK